MHKLILVEDDTSLGYLLSEYLGMKGFNMTWTKNGSEALSHMQANAYDLAVLDVMLPDMDGFELSKKMKSLCPSLPFIFLTARSMKIDVLKGFSMGAVDYLKKPIDEEELVVRIKALLSRLDSANPDEPILNEHIIGSYRLNARNMELFFGERSIKLTGKECDLLVFLSLNRNRLCTHREILTTLWDKNDYFNKKSLHVFISHLRKHLTKDPKIRIDNVHGRGFILRI
ncbi:MAG TPA: response regulator transcription factor [Pricia sp.]|nr:response regulator transcription factor [Pricia sp.]